MGRGRGLTGSAAEETPDGQRKTAENRAFREVGVLNWARMSKVSLEIEESCLELVLLREGRADLGKLVAGHRPLSLKST